ncbi:MAG: sugar ABC transporter ATP-binding protein [Rectinemataceae bacterium]
MSEDLILEMKGISKSYPGVKVFEDFDFDLRRGEVHCICGENGAGKSTLIKMLSGAHSPDKGAIYFNGASVHDLTPRSAMMMGIQTIYQEHNFFPLLTVVENLFAGSEINNGLIISKPKMVAKAQEILDYLHSDISPHDVVGKLGSGAQKIVEIAKALVQDSRVIILDEPTASFSQTEIDHLFEVIKRLVSNGMSVIYISHHLEEVFVLADRVTVIRDGRKVSTAPVGAVTEQTLIRDMVGRDVSLFYQRAHFPIGEVVFEARKLKGNGVTDVSLDLRKGELLGVAGMVGSGRTELADLLFGARRAEGGEILIGGKKVDFRTPLAAIRHRLCYITEDRQASGLFLKHPLSMNIPIVSYVRTRTPFALPSVDVKESERYVMTLGIMTPGVFQIAMLLSGGNQQKVVLAKWFMTNAEIFIFDEPTRGIDVGAKEEIYKIMIGLLEQGKSIIMISSDMPELIAMSDRVVVMRGGKLVARIDKEGISEEAILKHAIGSDQR